MSDVHDMSYYGKCMVGGIFACGLTHAIICPLDIVKCRKQVSTLPPSPELASECICPARAKIGGNFLTRFFSLRVGQPRDVQVYPRRLQKDQRY